MSIKFKVIPLALLLSALFLSGFSFLKLEDLRLPIRSQSDPSYLPKPEVARILSLGHTESVASLLWISCLIDYGGSLLDGTGYHWLSSMGDLSTQLDPNFETPYRFIGAVVSSKDTNSAATRTMERSVQMFPSNWQYSLFYASRIIDLDSNFALAAKVMKNFETDTLAPDYIRKIYRSYESQQNPFDIGLSILLQDYVNPQFSQFRVGIEKQIVQRACAQDSVMTTKNVNKTLTNLLNQQVQPHVAFRQIIQYHENCGISRNQLATH